MKVLVLKFKIYILKKIIFYLNKNIGLLNDENVSNDIKLLNTLDSLYKNIYFIYKIKNIISINRRVDNIRNIKLESENIPISEEFKNMSKNERDIMINSLKNTRFLNENEYLDLGKCDRIGTQKKTN